MMSKSADTGDLMKRIIDNASVLGKVSIMEVCGTHTQVISKSGIRSLLPENVRMITGPGCPVCITPSYSVNAAVKLAESGLSVACFGDALDLRGSGGSLSDAKGRGANVFVVESPADALEYDVFFAIGFDTTAPATACAIKEGLTVVNAHRRFIPAMEALLDMGETRIDGFICPGHVAAITGSEEFKRLDIAQVISGFEVFDILSSICTLLEMFAKDSKELVNEYRRAVSDKGNLKAKNTLEEVFAVGPGIWRGLGEIAGSGFILRKKYCENDAFISYGNLLEDIGNGDYNDGCMCHMVLRGIYEPAKCPLYGNSCTPCDPQGPCMVSFEGACNVSYRFG